MIRGVFYLCNQSFKRLTKKGDAMRKARLFVLMASICLLSTGCAVFMAANQPGNKNFNLLKPGMPRDVIIAEFGSPINTEEKEGEKTDIYRFVQGYPQGEKAFRAVGHGTMDVLTLGLWEVVGTPTEGMMHGKDVALKILYDKENKLKTLTYLAGK